MKKLHAFLTALMILSLAACNFPGGQPVATATNIEVGPTDTAASLPPTDTVPAAEPTATTGIPTTSALEAILIASPGGASVVTSPVTVEGQSRPTFEQTLVVAVYGEDGSLLNSQPTIIQAEAGFSGSFSTEISFTVDHQQPGRISVYETSAQYGGILHLNSMEVTLSPTGPANIIQAPIGIEDILIQFPAPPDPQHWAEISGGTVTISGISHYYFESTLGLVLCGDGSNSGGAFDELCGDAHNVLAGGIAMINSPDVGQPGPFSGTLTYSVSGTVNGRIIVYAASPRDGGWVHIASIPVVIKP